MRLLTLLRRITPDMRFGLAALCLLVVGFLAGGAWAAEVEWGLAIDAADVLAWPVVVLLVALWLGPNLLSIARDHGLTARGPGGFEVIVPPPAPDDSLSVGWAVKGGPAADAADERLDADQPLGDESGAGARSVSARDSIEDTAEALADRAFMFADAMRAGGVRAKVRLELHPRLGAPDEPPVVFDGLTPVAAVLLLAIRDLPERPRWAAIATAAAILRLRGFYGYEPDDRAVEAILNAGSVVVGFDEA